MTLFHLQIPTSLPYLFSALKVSSTLAVLGAIVGELIGSNSGLGYVMTISSAYLETSTLFAAIILSGLIGVILYSSIAFVEKRVVFWIKDKE
jgi:NitT/TauT family transport system permease protein